MDLRTSTYEYDDSNAITARAARIADAIEGAIASAGGIASTDERARRLALAEVVARYALINLDDGSAGEAGETWAWFKWFTKKVSWLTERKLGSGCPETRLQIMFTNTSSKSLCGVCGKVEDLEDEIVTYVATPVYCWVCRGCVKRLAPDITAALTAFESANFKEKDSRYYSAVVSLLGPFMEWSEREFALREAARLGAREHFGLPPDWKARPEFDDDVPF